MTTGIQLNDPFGVGEDVENDESSRTEKTASIRTVIEDLKKSNVTFAVLWQVKGSEPELEHSEDRTTKEAWERIISFLQHDLWWSIGDLVG